MNNFEKTCAIIFRFIALAIFGFAFWRSMQFLGRLLAGPDGIVEVISFVILIGLIVLGGIVLFKKSSALGRWISKD